MAEVRMKEVRDWLGRKRFVMDDTTDKPKTFAEREEEAIFDLFFQWLRWSLLPAGLVALFYLWPWEYSYEVDSMIARMGHWSALFMGLAILLILNLPNYAILIIRSLALWMVTYGRN